MGTAKSKVLVQVLLVITGIATTPCNGGALETDLQMRNVGCGMRN